VSRRAEVALLAALLLPAAAPAEEPAGCERTNWACVAECIDRRCSDACLGGRCEAPLKALRACSQKRGCGNEDSACTARECQRECPQAFGGGAREAPEEKDPCAGVPKVPVPKEWVGRWTVVGASMEPMVQDGGAAPGAQPRADYGKVFVVSATGCFVMQERLGSPSLGQGNWLVVRGWGPLRAKKAGKRALVTLDTRSGQAAGTLCDEPRVFDLRGAQFQRPTYELKVEKDVLTLTATTPDRQTYEFRRAEPRSR